MAFQSSNVGIQFPDYLQNSQAGQSRSREAWGDRNRAAFAKSIGADSFTGNDGRPDYAKTMGLLKGFCK